MEISPQSDRSVVEEEEQDFLTQPARRKKRSLAATRAALRPWAIGIGLTVLVAVAAVGAYTLGASISSWNDRPSTAATPTVYPAPMPSASSEPPMSGGYVIGPDGVLVRPAEFAADTYTKPELPEAAKENTERGAEAAAEHYLAVATYAWNTGDTAAIAALSDDASGFAQSLISKIDVDYSNGWVYGKSLTIDHVLLLEPVPANGSDVPPNTIGVKFSVTAVDGTKCSGKHITVHDEEYQSTISLFMTWRENRWIETQGRAEANEH